MHCCGDCRYGAWSPFDKTAVTCKALPPGYTGGDHREWTAWHNPELLRTRPACSLYQPKEDVPALGEVLGEESEV